MFFSEVSYETTVAKKIGGVAIFVAIFLAVRKRREASRKGMAILLRVAISWLLPAWLFPVAISVAISSLFLNLGGYFLRGYFLCVAIF